MNSKAVMMDNDTRSWLLDDSNKRRNLDVVHTQYGTEIFVENGVLVEQKRISGHLSSLNGHNGVSCSSPPSSPEPSSRYSKEKLKEFLCQQDLRTASAAIKYYNKKHKVDYELVQPVACNGDCLKGGIWFHCNFKAKPRTSSN